MHRTIKLDNPNDGITREQVSAVMQPALTNEWFLTTKGSPAVYLGDITLNTSIKTKLGGEDFYVTPNSITYVFLSSKTQDTKTVTVSGATIQGYNITNLTNPNLDYKATVADNGLSISLKITNQNLTSGEQGNFKLNLVIQGTIVTINGAYTNQS